MNICDEGTWNFLFFFFFFFKLKSYEIGRLNTQINHML